MKKKLFLGLALLASSLFAFVAMDKNDSSIFKASLLEESQQEASLLDWKNALEKNEENT